MAFDFDANDPESLKALFRVMASSGIKFVSRHWVYLSYLTLASSAISFMSSDQVYFGSLTLSSVGKKKQVLHPCLSSF